MEIRRPILKPYDKDKFELVEEYQYKDITVPIGFKTNGANVPRIFWSIFPPNSPEYLSAIILHDYLCDIAKTQKDYKYADNKLKEVMTALGANRFTRQCFYLSCRAYHKIKYKGLKDVDNNI